MAVPPEPGAPTLRRTRNPNYRSTIYKDKHGRWVGRVTMGIRDTTQAATVLLIRRRPPRQRHRRHHHPHHHPLTRAASNQEAGRSPERRPRDQWTFAGALTAEWPCPRHLAIRISKLPGPQEPVPRAPGAPIANANRLVLIVS